MTGTTLKISKSYSSASWAFLPYFGATPHTPPGWANPLQAFCTAYWTVSAIWSETQPFSACSLLWGCLSGSHVSIPKTLPWGILQENICAERAAPLSSVAQAFCEIKVRRIAAMKYSWCLQLYCKAVQEIWTLYHQKLIKDMHFSPLGWFVNTIVCLFSVHCICVIVSSSLFWIDSR